MSDLANDPRDTHGRLVRLETIVGSQQALLEGIDGKVDNLTSFFDGSKAVLAAEKEEARRKNWRGTVMISLLSALATALGSAATMFGLKGH